MPEDRVSKPFDVDAIHEHVSDPDPIDAIDKGDELVSDQAQHPGLTGTPSQAADQGVGPSHPLGGNFDGDGGPDQEPELPLREPDHVQIAPEQATRDPLSKRIYLPALISDEFGIQQDSAREMVLMGVVKINGDEMDMRPGLGWVAYSELLDAEIEVNSDIKSVKFVYGG